MIQILGLREFVNRDGAVKKTDDFFDNEWRAPDIYDLFTNMEKYVEEIPEHARWNMYYTVASCTNQKRQFLRQDVIPLDIDEIVKGTEDKVTDTVCRALDLNPDDLGIVYSGNGVHILIGLQNPIDDPAYIKNNKIYYKALCGRVNSALFEAGLSGKADPTVFSESRILRLPYTKNVKKNREDTYCKLIKGKLVPLNVDLFSLADMPSVSEGEHISNKALKNFPPPDKESIEAGCSFIRHCRDTTEDDIREPAWYAMLSIVGRFPNGQEEAHKYSSPQGNRHPKYSYNDTQNKLEHALEASGPRTCENISDMWEGCKTCPHYGNITSPIQIIGDGFIRTQTSGFYDTVLKAGVPTKTKPNYDDLEKWFKRHYKYITIEDNQTLMTYTGTHWIEMPSLRVHKFAEESFDPTPTHHMCMEFESKLKRMHITPLSEMTVENMLNFQNGVLDLDTGELVPHSDEYRFTYVIPYDYEPKGDCPRFKQFLQEVSCDDQEVVKVLGEYIGYCISGTDPELVQKCAILYGDGSNGKSVLISLMRELVGMQNCSAMTIDSIKKETNRYQLMGKLFNAAAESPANSFLDSEMFKSLVAGDTVEVRKLYGEPMMWKCTTKMMFACNDLPFSGDFSDGMRRRLLILPFKNTFSDAKGNKDPLLLRKLLEERSDIFKYCLDAFAECKARGYKFLEPKVSADELDEYQEMGDVVARFVESMCDYKADPELEPAALEKIYSMFCLWCKDTGQTNVSYGWFARRVGKVLQKKYPQMHKMRPRTNSVSGGRGTAYAGLVIKATTF